MKIELPLVDSRTKTYICVCDVFQAIRVFLRIWTSGPQLTAGHSISREANMADAIEASDCVITVSISITGVCTSFTLINVWRSGSKCHKKTTNCTSDRSIETGSYTFTLAPSMCPFTSLFPRFSSLAVPAYSTYCK